MLHHVSLALQLCAGVTSQETGKSLKNVNWMGSHAEEVLGESWGQLPLKVTSIYCFATALF